MGICMRILIAAAALLVAAAPATAQTVTVHAKDNIYGAGARPAPGGGRVPPSIVVPSGSVCFTVTKVQGSSTCASKEKCITLNGGGNLNDPDGVGAAPTTSSNTGTATISGITAPDAGYLVGLFSVSKGPSGAAPAALDFTTGKTTHFTSLAPELDQTFFIGDGRTGDGKGMSQTFSVPAGAGKLWLGISDACGYNGAPGCFNDNSGRYRVVIVMHHGSCP